jgi:hypothetical protein
MAAKPWFTTNEEGMLLSTRSWAEMDSFKSIHVDLAFKGRVFGPIEVPRHHFGGKEISVVNPERRCIREPRNDGAEAFCLGGFKHFMELPRKRT